MENGRLALPAVEAQRVRDEAAIRGLLHGRSSAELAAIEPLLTEACSHRPLVLKGPAAARLYPEPALRPFADLDLLVPRDRLAAAAKALEPRGYRTAGGVRAGVRRDPRPRRAPAAAGRPTHRSTWSCTGGWATTSSGRALSHELHAAGRAAVRRGGRRAPGPGARGGAARARDAPAERQGQALIWVL